MRKPEAAGNLLASKVLPVGLLFVSVTAIVRVIQESGQQPMTRLIASLLGPFATGAVLLGMCVVAGIWFLHGDIAFPFRKILALALVGLPTAMLFGVLQPANLRVSWGGLAGANLGSMVAFLPDTLAAGLSVLLLVVSAWLAWRIAFGTELTPQMAHTALAGIAISVPSVMPMQPMQATALLEEVTTAEPVRSSKAKPRQSTLFDTLGDTESMIRAAEIAANAPVRAEVASTECDDTVVPPWLAGASAAMENTTPPAARTAAAISPAAVVTPAPSAHEIDAFGAGVSDAFEVGVRDAFEVGVRDAFGVGIAEEPATDLDDISDLNPLEGEALPNSVEEEPEPVESSEVAVTEAALVEELEEDDLLAEDSAGDYTIEDDLDAEIETAPQVAFHAVTPMRATVVAEDEFSVAAAEAHATLSAVDAPITAAPKTAAVAHSDEGVLLLHPALMALAAPLATDDEWMPKPMAVSAPVEECSSDEFELSRTESALATIHEAEAAVTEEAPLFTAATETPAALTQLFTASPALHEGLSPEAESSRPAFTLLRGGPEVLVVPTVLPAHLAPATLEASESAVASQPAAKQKGARKGRHGTAWASWEEGSAKGRRTAKSDSPDATGQAFLFAASQEPEADLMRRAEQLVVAEQRCSELMLQRKLELSWSAASRIVEHLERGGFVSAPDAAGRREVLRRGEASVDADSGF